MSEEMKMVEITDAETTVSTIAIPNKVTGYLAFYQQSIGKWDMVTSFDPNKPNHPILPYYAYTSKQEAVTAAMALKYTKTEYIKIVAVDFEA